ncbi:MAG: FAD-dependent oxidoreductase, partial [Armatimonadetes bacterium]|nr:FAD-dependent oxidoreductase [Armatimonadota bacterium]
MTGPTRILILGGGFAGVSAASWLERHLRPEDNVQILLMDRNNFSLFTPLLPEVPSGSIEAKHIVAPLRARFQRVHFRQAAVGIVDMDKREVWAIHCESCH